MYASEKYSDDYRVNNLRKHIFKLALNTIKPIESWLWKIKILRKPLQIIFDYSAPDDWLPVEVHGIKIYINMRCGAVAKSIIQKGTYEEGTTNLFIKSMRKGAVVIDVGAHCGYYSLIAAKLVGDEGKVFAFEPHPANFKLLKRTISFNMCNNIIPINKAVGDTIGKTRLFLHTSGQHSIVRKGKKHIQVEVVNLDRFFQENKISPDVIKIDVEGAEILTLKGMDRTLKDSKNLKLFIERGHDEQEIKSFLAERGFTIYYITGNGTLLREPSKKVKLEPNMFAIKQLRASWLRK